MHQCRGLGVWPGASCAILLIANRRNSSNKFEQFISGLQVAARRRLTIVWRRSWLRFEVALGMRVSDISRRPIRLLTVSYGFALFSIRIEGVMIRLLRPLDISENPVLPVVAQPLPRLGNRFCHSSLRPMRPLLRHSVY
jgi:hypothetical protein